VGRASPQWLRPGASSAVILVRKEEKGSRPGLAGIFRHWFVKYTVLLVTVLFCGFILIQAFHRDKQPGEPPDVRPTVERSVGHPAATETESGPAPQAKVGRPVPPGPGASVVWHVPVGQRVVYLTIDDGWFPSQGVLTLMRQYHLPVTAFLIEEAAAEHATYWKEFLADGGTIEDHTYSHPFLTRIPEGQDLTQIKDPITYFKSLGASPDELRPPYGDYDQAVQKIAYQAGIRYVVMWAAEMKDGRLTTYNGRPLAPGDIILLHWVPGLDANLTELIHILQQEKLGVASLSGALDGGPLRISWLGENPPRPSPPATAATVYGSVYTRGEPAPKSPPAASPYHGAARD